MEHPKLDFFCQNRILRRQPKKQKQSEKKILFIFGTFLDFDDLFLANETTKTKNKYRNRILHVRITQKVKNVAENLFF